MPIEYSSKTGKYITYSKFRSNATICGNITKLPSNTSQYITLDYLTGTSNLACYHTSSDLSPNSTATLQTGSQKKLAHQNRIVYTYKNANVASKITRPTLVFNFNTPDFYCGTSFLSFDYFLNNRSIDCGCTCRHAEFQFNIVHDYNSQILHFFKEYAATTAYNKSYIKGNVVGATVSLFYYSDPSNSAANTYMKLSFDLQDDFNLLDLSTHFVFPSNPTDGADWIKVLLSMMNLSANSIGGTHTFKTDTFISSGNQYTYTWPLRIDDNIGYSHIKLAYVNMLLSANASSYINYDAPVIYSGDIYNNTQPVTINVFTGGYPKVTINDITINSSSTATSVNSNISMTPYINTFVFIYGSGHSMPNSTSYTDLNANPNGLGCLDIFVDKYNDGYGYDY